MRATLTDLASFIERATKLIDDGLIEELDETKSKFSEFKEVLLNSEYLADITEEVIYDALSETIREYHSRPFVNFT